MPGPHSDRECAKVRPCPMNFFPVINRDLDVVVAVDGSVSFLKTMLIKTFLQGILKGLLQKNLSTRIALLEVVNSGVISMSPSKSNIFLAIKDADRAIAAHKFKGMDLSDESIKLGLNHIDTTLIPKFRDGAAKVVFLVASKIETGLAFESAKNLRAKGANFFVFIQNTGKSYNRALEIAHGKFHLKYIENGQVPRVQVFNRYEDLLFK
eukprot:UC4_evm1s1407